jgi:hypothetical protein
MANTIMDVNVGNLDRAARITAGIVLIGLAVLRIIGPWGYVGVLPLITGVLRVCPAYSIFGWNTCALRKH